MGGGGCPFSLWYSLGKGREVEWSGGVGGELVYPLALNYLELMEGGAEGGRGGGEGEK